MSSSSPARGSTAAAAASSPRSASGGSKPLTIVHVVAPAPFGGLESVLHSLAGGQQRRGDRAFVFAILSPEERSHPFVEKLRAAGIPTEAIHVSGRGYLEERRRIATLARSAGADVIHTHGYRPDVVDSGVAGGLRIPRVSTVHGFCAGTWRSRLYESLQLRMLRRFDAVVAVAPAQLQRLLDAGLRRERIHVLPNAWAGAERLDAASARAALGVPEGEFHLGWVGRLSREKAADVLIEAVAQLPDLPGTVSIIGDGREREMLQTRAAELGISARLRWQGALPDAGRYFAAFDGFVLSSRTEGTPMVLFEAMSADTPIVATAVGGVPNVLSPEEALLVPSEDSTELAAAIRALYLDPAGAAARAARAGVRLSRDFGPAKWLEQHDDLYRQLIHSYTRKSS